MSHTNSEPGELPVIDSAPAPCRHLRNKGMYVYTDGAIRSSHEDYDNTIYWCVQTHKGFGPDDDLVSGDDCRNAGRSCYEPL